VFLILTLLKVREKIVEAIPLGVRYGIAPAIGLMLIHCKVGQQVRVERDDVGHGHKRGKTGKDLSAYRSTVGLIASAIGTICMAFFANKPFVMAPGMGLNSFFAVVVAKGHGHKRGKTGKDLSAYRSTVGLQLK